METRKNGILTNTKLKQEDTPIQIEGIWTMEYFALAGWREAGILIFKDGTVTGGNNHHYILGSYEETDGLYNIKVEIAFMESVDGFFPVEGRFPAKIEGKPEGSIFSGSVSRVDVPWFHLPLKMTKRADIS